MKNNTTRDKLKTVDFFSLNGVNVADALYFNYYEITANKKDFFSSVIRAAISLLSIAIQYNVRGNAEIAFVYSNSYKNRSDHIKVMSSVANLFSSRLFIAPGRRKVYLNNLKYLPLAFRWYDSLSAVFSVKRSIYYMSMLLFGVTNAKYIEKIVLKKKCKSVIVLSDMHLIDSILVQLCNNDGIVTATLQHGNFEDDEPFLLSKSKYFLTHGQYSMNKAIGFGADKDKMIVAGFPKLIKTDLPNKMERRNSKMKTIGIVLSGREFSDSDTKLVNMICDYTMRKGIDVLVKLHPNSCVEDYPDINWQMVKRSYITEISVEEFRQLIDIAVVYNSTVFIEYVLFLFPTLIFKDDRNSFIPEIQWCKFNCIKEFETLVLSLENDPESFNDKLVDTRTFFSPTDNIDKRYISIINEISKL